MDAKTWLSRGFNLKREKEQLERMRAETLTRLTKMTQNISGEVVSGTKDPYKFDEIVQLDMEIDEAMKKLDAARLEIFRTIQKLPNRRHRMVLLGRYYECLAWSDLATLMHYEERQLFRLHGAALAAIEPIIGGKHGD